jgi:hypothetical protein
MHGGYFNFNIDIDPIPVVLSQHYILLSLPNITACSLEFCWTVLVLPNIASCCLRVAATGSRTQTYNANSYP